VNPLLLPFVGAPGVGVPVLLLHSYPTSGRRATSRRRSATSTSTSASPPTSWVWPRERSSRSYELAPSAKNPVLLRRLGSGRVAQPRRPAVRNAVSSVIGQWVDRDEWALADTRRVITRPPPATRTASTASTPRADWDADPTAENAAASQAGH
jgi:hypothetical protein